MDIIFGCDEVARGCVIGNLFICGVICEEDRLQELRNIGVKDSKELSSRQREKLFPNIIKIIKDYKIIEVSPAEIDNNNINDLERKYITELINFFEPNIAYFDCPVSWDFSDKFVKSVTDNLIKKNIKIVGEPKADKTYPIVSAASILAKITRDNFLEKLKKEYNFDLGCGYPHDPKTIEFLKRNIDNLPTIVRMKWQTVQQLKKESKDH